ncbi:helix-turn-helix transcriptional regulator [Enterococcus plantarum]|uniref:helix-turn-helix transcriptional regulator n=1 Tax=Enterococcus TaxID=1350 RepID=UPI001A9019A9|nr:WYL domain-containing protein [Enterococcus plantarum]MBO0422394.1 WYL domain-containing protein [Enterococcus plantarum]MBO0467602.1 WYL domain-containing protein [Enterococcus plantarum]
MKKAERINDMILFLADRNSFNLKELIERYQISKSTALRDIQSLEEIGLPIYSELGRYGKYQLLDTRIVAPGLFTEGEIYALYFALLTLKGYRSTPFTIESSTLELKYSQVLPEKLRQELQLMREIVSLEQVNHSNTSQYLKEIVQGILHEKVFNVRYDKKQESVMIKAQFVKLSSKLGQWYARIWNVETQQIRVIRCDKITLLEEEESQVSLSLEDLLEKDETFYQNEQLIPFSIKVDEKGKDIFSKENYPSMSIQVTEGGYLISGSYHAAEEEFITSFILRFGKSILQIEPDHLKDSLVKKASSLVQYLNHL